ncbi:hypothetical protein DFJ67_4549 [Asanoa ferruginea]|uniref:Uncharacterized protein n=1 Tax=Asanoa ferruginea TaxID=53367 RepID=A0A3D9ZMS5_9ACTN|nr:hypothetical protein [Asanoa ferruginea]REF98531.1 hypothetical protein DFJ67_4549 [Asanoa ferruginea]GIF53579.1 hypothetical protein Afe04nite_81180 [Asanoa ferruginea]
MELLPCGHAALAGSRRVCRHLIEPDSEQDYFRLFTGIGAEYELACQPCVDDTPDLLVVCEGCLARALDNNSVDGYRGTPAVLDRPEPMSIALDRRALPFAPLDIAPVPGAPHRWLLLSPSGVVEWHSDDRPSSAAMVRFELPDVPAEGHFPTLPPRPRLHVSPSARFCAVVVDFGRHGIVVDLAAGRIVAELDRGEYRPGTQRVPFAFLALDDGEAYVHGTNWDRVDISDAATGRLRTARDSSAYNGYFHGELVVSPDGRWIADDGWVWTPVGMPQVWSVDAWLSNPGEPEDGPTRRRLADRPDWNEPIVWCGDHVVLRGLGTWLDPALLPGAAVHDPATGAVILEFAGPTGRLLSHGGRLFATTATGVEVWDPVSGARTARIPDFRPTVVHPASGELLALDSTTAVIGTLAA